MYLVAGMVARSVAGPGVVVSFIIAAIASIFSGKCLLSSYCHYYRRRHHHSTVNPDDGDGRKETPLLLCCY